jgi:hypothetical protein
MPNSIQGTAKVNDFKLSMRAKVGLCKRRLKTWTRKSTTSIKPIQYDWHYNCNNSFIYVNYRKGSGVSRVRPVDATCECSRSRGSGVLSVALI